MKSWFVAQAVRRREFDAALSVQQHGFNAYVPGVNRQHRRAGVLVNVEVPRFGCYVFVEFDPEVDHHWPDLCRELPFRRRYFERVLCFASGRPKPVPTEAMDAIRAFQPYVETKVDPYVFKPGEAVLWTMAGVSRQAVFLRYEGNRQFVTTYVFGADRTTEVRNSDLEPMGLEEVKTA